MNNPQPIQASLLDRASEDTRGISLSAFMEVVTRRVSTIPPAWVTAEISQIRNQKHLYLELVEHGEDGKEIAKCRGVIWAGKATKLIAKFKAATGGNLDAGMKVMLYGAPTFHAQYGFSFNIEDIDPSFTLGDMQRKLKEIRDLLTREGVFESNRALRRPLEFTRIAVVSPQDAAGLGDFKAMADWLQKYQLCQFDYFTSVFQGPTAAPGLCDALQKIQARHADQPYDATVIIRGGGAVTDLAWLNEYAIAKMVCQMPMAVLAGIGHERDATIIDEVACQTFDTPSKVIGHVMDTIVRNAREAASSWDSIWNIWQLRHAQATAGVESALRVVVGEARAAVAQSRLLTDGLHATIRQSTNNALRFYPQALETRMQLVRERALAMTAKSRHEIDLSMGQVKMQAANFCAEAQRECDIRLDQVKDKARQAIGKAREMVGNQMEYITGMGPRQTLKRGYTIVRSNGSVVTSAEQASQCSAVDIEFHDGHVQFKKEN